MNSSTLATWTVTAISPNSAERTISLHGNLFDGLTQNAFGGSVAMPPEALRTALNQSTHLGVLRASGQIVGFMLLFVPAVKLQGRTLLYINKLIIASDWQGFGYGACRAVLNAFTAAFPEYIVGWLCARTQNPALMRSFINVATVNYPFTEPFFSDCSERGFGLLHFGLMHVPQLNTSYEPGNEFILSRGIFKGIYGCQLGEADLSKGSPEAEQLLSRLNFNRKSGDALFIASQLYNDADNWRAAA